MAMKEPLTVDGLNEATLVQVGKRTPQDAAYVSSHGERNQCGGCRFFARRLKGVSGQCQLVHGSINWQGSCRFYLSAQQVIDYTLEMAQAPPEPLAQDIVVAQQQAQVVQPQVSALSIGTCPVAFADEMKGEIGNVDGTRTYDRGMHDRLISQGILRLGLYRSGRMIGEMNRDGKQWTYTEKAEARSRQGDRARNNSR